MANRDVAVKGLQKRYANLAAVGPGLPALETIQTPAGMQLEEVVAMLPTEGFVERGDSHHQNRQQEGHPTEAAREYLHGEQAEVVEHGDEHHADSDASQEVRSSINRSALALALCGWDTVPEGVPELVACGACFRRLGLWLYKPSTNGDVTAYNALDVANEHMDYCPWNNGRAQSGTGKQNKDPETLLSGWELLLRAIKVKHRQQARATSSRDTLQREDERAEAEELDSDDETRKASDREWWAKLRRMKQLLDFRGKGLNQRDTSGS